MRVKELIDYLEKCNTDSIVFTGSDVTDENDIFAVMEVSVSSQCKPGVYILGE